MIRSLRKKFIFFAMIAITVLLFTLLFAINGLGRLMFELQAEKVLDTLAESDGDMLRMDPPPQKEPIGWDGILPKMMDNLRTARFFVVRVSEDGIIISSDMREIIFVSEDDAIDYARTAIENGTSSGTIDRYKYRMQKKNDEIVVYFLDMTREKITIRTVFIASTVIAILAWLLSLLFVILYSDNFVRPIIAGIEKQKQFITNAGHELKTPLAIIQSNNDAMTLIHGENKYNRNIKDQVIRLSDLTAYLLMQAKLDEEIELVTEPVNISELAATVILPYKDDAECRNISFRADITPDIIFTTNKDSFLQLLNILMDNAKKYTTEEGSIHFSLLKESGHIRIIEENSCAPDLDADPEKLFERFYRADSARTQKDKYSGYGIGLSVSRSICEALGGKITADYPQQGMVRFTIKF